MRITSKGQVTIPIHIREKAGLLPGMDVEFLCNGDTVSIVRAKRRTKRTPAEEVIRALRGSATIRMTTDEIMALTRGE